MFDVRDIADLALSCVQADEADVFVLATDRNVTRFANSIIHQNMSEETAQVTLRVAIGERIGVASTTATGREQLIQAAETARQIALRSVPVSGFRGFYRGEDPESDSPAGWDQETADISPIQKAEELRDAFETASRRHAHFAGAYATSRMEIAAANSHGVRRSTRTTAADALLIATAERTSGYASRISRRARGVGVATLADEAVERALLLTGDETTIDPGEYDVVLEPAAIAELLEWMTTVTFCGRVFEEGSSFFSGAIGKTLAGPNVTIADDPVDPDFLPFPFDVEGVPKRRVPLIEAGRIGTPAVDKLMADRFSLPLTASAASLGGEEHGVPLHLSMKEGSATPEELIGSTRRGIWVTRFNYVNGLLEPRTAKMTGLTRDGTFLIENGSVTRRLPNLRWTQEILSALNRVEGLTKERRAIATWWNPFGGILAPAVKFSGWRFDGMA